jgi:arylsulfatase
MAYSFGDADQEDRRRTQYFEMFCNRGIYHEGWTAVTRHSTPWVMGPMPSFEDDVSELYDTNADWSQAHDLAAEMPEKLAELKELWLAEAHTYQVLPLDDRRIERFNPDLAGRPVLVKGSKQILFGGMGRLTEASVLNIKNKSHAVTAEIEVPEAGAEGVIIAQGGAFAGWSLYVKDGRPRYCYNLLGIQRFTIEGDAPIPSGTTRCGWSSDTTAAASPRAVPSSSTSTGPRSAKVASTRRSRWSSPPTRRPTWGATQPPR